VGKVLIVDLDVHQGNGTARIFAHEDSVFTFSMHGLHNYPLKKEKSDLDIDLPTGADDNTYLKILTDTLPNLIDHHRPGLVFYQAGVDVLATDKLGKLSLTKEGCKIRDEIVLTHCYQHQIPVVVTMGGGYSARIADIVEAHCNTFKVAMGIFG
jgi:acetoin utilization deacetylase AcuC-like enzyme